MLQLHFLRSQNTAFQRQSCF